MYRDSTVGVVVPAYNEEGLVGEVIDTIPAYVDRVYVVDDGSTDGTWSELRDHAAAANATTSSAAGFDERVVPIQHEENRGVGGAIKTGYRHALADDLDVTAVMGGDGQMDPAVLPGLLDPVVDGDADYAKGNRFMRAEDLDSMPRFRLVGNAVLSFLTKVASGYWTINDPQNGYTAISSDALRQVSIEEMYEYYGYCNDLLIRLNAANCTIADVPHSALYDTEESTITYSEYIPRVSRMLLDGFFRRLNRKHLVREFNPLALAYYAGATAVGVASVGVLNALRNRRDSGGWVATAVLGVALLLAGMAMDRADSRHREVLVSDATIERGGDHEGPSSLRVRGTRGTNGAPTDANETVDGTADDGAVNVTRRSNGNAQPARSGVSGGTASEGSSRNDHRTVGGIGAENSSGASDVSGVIDAGDVEVDDVDAGEVDAGEVDAGELESGDAGAGHAESDGIDRGEGDVSGGDSFDEVGDDD